jgi:hypothetical protein
MMLLAIYEFTANDVDFAKIATSISKDKLLVEQNEIRNKLLVKQNLVSEEKREQLKHLCNWFQANDGTLQLKTLLNYMNTHLISFK